MWAGTPPPSPRARQCTIICVPGAGLVLAWECRRVCTLVGRGTREFVWLACPVADSPHTSTATACPRRPRKTANLGGWPPGSPGAVSPGCAGHREQPCHQVAPAPPRPGSWNGSVPAGAPGARHAQRVPRCCSRSRSRLLRVATPWGLQGSGRETEELISLYPVGIQLPPCLASC